MENFMMSVRCFRVTLFNKTPMGTSGHIHSLVSNNWVSHEMNNITDSSKLRILDVSFSLDKTVDGYKDFFLSGHIPTAKFFDLYKNVESTELIPRNLPKTSDFENYVQELGVCGDSHVVVYDRTTTMAALRLWWMMRLYGHTKTSVLDGGLSKWVSDGYPLSCDDPKTDIKSDFKVNFNKALLRDYDSTLRNLESRLEQLVDTRSPHNFNGISGPQSGHIPGSINIPFAFFFNEDGTFRDMSSLETVFQSAGVDLTRPVTATCNSGMTACSVAFAAHLLQKEDVPVYYGSWTEWSRRAPPDLCSRLDR